MATPLNYRCIIQSYLPSTDEGKALLPRLQRKVNTCVSARREVIKGIGSPETNVIKPGDLWPLN